MKTVSFSIANYCVPCHAPCRYCLLSSCGMTGGVDPDAGMEFAGRVMREMAETRPEISVSYYIGYCMDTPKLTDYIRFCREHRCPGAKFLQMNGFAFREKEELQTLMNSIRENGVELIDLTFFGTEEYHDCFAGRKGDFHFLTEMLDAAAQAELPVNASVPLLRGNLTQMPDLYRYLSGRSARKLSFFLPHSKGRGGSVAEERITKAEFEQLPEEIRNSFQRTKHLTEAEWLTSGEITEPEKRNLTLVLTQDTLAQLENRPAEEILGMLEEMDDRYLAEMLSAKELAERYGNPGNKQLFRLRDLLLQWQQRYISENGNTIYDMYDETHHFSVHQ